MKIVVFTMVFFLSSFAIDISYKGEISVKHEEQNFKAPISAIYDDIDKEQFIAMFESKALFGDYVAVANIIGLEDTEDKNKDYFKPNELYIQKEFENFNIKVGRDIKYWGALELTNITDIYNDKNVDLDMYDKEKKLGTNGLTVNYFFDNEDEIVTIISSKNDNISKYIKYSSSLDLLDGIDVAFAIKKDEKIENYLTYNTMIIDDNIFKLEYINTKLLKDSLDSFYEFGLGYEKSFYRVYGKSDIDLFLEYYKSDKIAQNSLIFQNDIFFGLKFDLNDVDSSEIIIAGIKDIDEDEFTYQVEFNRRFFDTIKTKLSYIRNDYFDIVTIQAGYYF